MVQISRADAWALSLAMLAVVAGGLALGLRGWFPPVASVHGQGIQLMLDFTLAAASTLFVAGHLVLAWLILRGLRRPQAAARATPRVERLVALWPAFLMTLIAEGGVLALGLPVWAKYYGPAPGDAVRVEVSGRQFFWAVRYPGPDGVFGRAEPDRMSTDNPRGMDPGDTAGADDLVLLNELGLPRGRPARLTLRSFDVIHSFYVPELRVKQNAVPGMGIDIWFTPTVSGEYEIACNQICGLGHYRMRGFLHVMEPADFERWLAEQASPPPRP